MGISAGHSQHSCFICKCLVVELQNFSAVYWEHKSSMSERETSAVAASGRVHLGWNSQNGFSVSSSISLELHFVKLKKQGKKEHCFSPEVCVFFFQPSPHTCHFYCFCKNSKNLFWWNDWADMRFGEPIINTSTLSLFLGPYVTFKYIDKPRLSVLLFA